MYTTIASAKRIINNAKAEGLIKSGEINDVHTIFAMLKHVHTQYLKAVEAGNIVEIEIALGLMGKYSILLDYCNTQIIEYITNATNSNCINIFRQIDKLN
jgi:hypothetical protein